MSTKRVSMQKLKEILRLRFEAGLSGRQVARCTNLSVGVVSKYLRRFGDTELPWPLPDDIGESELAKALRGPEPQRSLALVEPDFHAIECELRRKGMTRLLLWQEYARDNPERHYSYSRFTVRYKQWRRGQQLSMRQSHLAGERMFVDYCGPTLEVVNPDTGEIRTAQVFVAVLGASSYTFAEATWTQTLPDWIGSHVRAFEFFGGTPAIVVPDNLKSAVSKACRYDPDLNPTYQQMAEHYGVAVIPARPYKPRDKAKAESGVQLVERWIMMRLRHRSFYTLAALNAAIRELLADLNNRTFKKRPGTRRSQFEQIDRPALHALPEAAYAYRHVKKARVHVDYHVSYEGHHYSVPYQLARQEVMVHAGERTVAIFHQGKQVAVHPRAYHAGGHSTDPEHMAAAHRKHGEWSPQRLLNWAEDIGPHTQALVRHQLESRVHPEHGYRACLGLLSLARKYGRDRLEAACQRALHIGALRYRNVASILANNMDRVSLEASSPAQPSLPLDHENVRGSEYFH